HISRRLIALSEAFRKTRGTKMDKPRAFIHFEQTYTHDEMGVLAIGRVHIPTVVLIVFIALAAIVLTVVSGITGWWSIIAGYGIIVGSLAILGGLVSLLTWMGRAVIKANSANVRERNERGY